MGRKSCSGKRLRGRAGSAWGGALNGLRDSGAERRLGSDMIRTLIRRQIHKSEEALGTSLEYLRHMVRVSLPAFLRFTKIVSISNYRRKLPIEPCHVARLVAARDEDCGTCVQIEVEQARRAGVSEDVLRAVLRQSPEDLPTELGDVYRFAHSVVRADGSDAIWREAVRGHYGEEALVELALALASARFFPITKRALGYAVSCSEVVIR